MKILQMTEPGGPEVLRYTEAPVPEPQPGQVLIEVEYAGLNFTDALARRGIPGYASGWPFVPGMEVSGVVAQVSRDVTGLQVGDKVISFTVDGGGFAQFVAAESQLTVIIPDSLNGATASSIPLTWATAIGLVRRSAAGPGNNVLITSAAGGVGHALAALLPRHRVGRVVGGIGAVTKASGLANGVVGVERGTDFFARAKDTAGGRPFDVILESLGGDMLAGSIAEVAAGGTVISYGAAAGQKNDATPTPSELRTRNISLAGFSIINLSRAAPSKTRDLIESVLALTQKDLVIPAPKIIGWEDAIAAHIAQAEGHATGKTVVRIH